MVVLFSTTRYWAKCIVGIVSYVYAKSLFGAPIFLLFGNLNIAKQLAIAVIYSVSAVLLTWRHLERDPAGVERVGLVGFVMGAPFALALHSVLPLVVGLALLGSGELTERLRHALKRKRSKTSPLDPLPLG